MSGADFVTAFPAREVRFAGRNARLHEARSKLLDEITALSRELKLIRFQQGGCYQRSEQAYDENITKTPNGGKMTMLK